MSSDCEIARYYICKEPVARKAHACCECSAPINPGEQYLQCNAMWEGIPTRERQHLLCARACELVRDAGMNDDECLFYGGLFEWWDQAKDDHWQWDELKTNGSFKKLRGMLYRIKTRERQFLRAKWTH